MHGKANQLKQDGVAHNAPKKSSSGTHKPSSVSMISSQDP
jgi:hypothetical protein